MSKACSIHELPIYSEFESMGILKTIYVIKIQTCFNACIKHANVKQIASNGIRVAVIFCMQYSIRMLNTQVMLLMRPRLAYTNTIDLHEYRIRWTPAGGKNWEIGKLTKNREIGKYKIFILICFEVIHFITYPKYYYLNYY